MFKECILCHAVCNCHYLLYFFAQWCTVLRPLLSEYLENGQIRNCSAIDSLPVEVWVKSISNSCISLRLKCFLLVLCERREGRLEQKVEIINVCLKTKPGSTMVKCGDMSNAWETWAPNASADSFQIEQPAHWSTCKRSLEAWLLHYQHHC